MVTGILSLVRALDVIVVSQSALANSMLLVISVIFVGNALADSTIDIEKAPHTLHCFFLRCGGTPIHQKMRLAEYVSALP